LVLRSKCSGDRAPEGGSVSTCVDADCRNDHSDRHTVRMPHEDRNWMMTALWCASRWTAVGPVPAA